MEATNEPYLLKAIESLAGAESEFAAGRFNNCANRCYYACFQAAIVALERENIRPSGGNWSHAFVPSQFDGLLIHRRKRYPAGLRGTLTDMYSLRVTADYSREHVTRADANAFIASELERLSRRFLDQEHEPDDT